MQDSSHPFHRFHFCPLCGSGRFVEHGANARHCEDCGFTYYTNPRGATVALIINEQGELLCGRRVNDPARGTRDLVGGFLDLDETAEEGMCREILEETGLLVQPSQLHYLFSQPNRYLFRHRLSHHRPLLRGPHSRPTRLLRSRRHRPARMAPPLPNRHLRIRPSVHPRRPHPLPESLILFPSILILLISFFRDHTIHIESE